MRRNFGEVSFEQLLFHIQFGTENLLDSDPVLVANFYIRCIYIPIVLASIFSIATTFKTSLLKLLGALFKFIGEKIHSIGFFPKIVRLPLYTKILTIGLIYAAYNFSLFAYIKNELLRPQDDFYAQHYINPANVKIEKNNPKNLILIYVESLENTYSNSDLFGENLLHSLDPRVIGGQSFTKQRQLPGTNWTIAGITASQCGVPLKASFGGTNLTKTENRTFEKSSKFLPKAICLGDILKSSGYKNIFMGGAPLHFAGKNAFFKTHGYDELYGREEFLALKNAKFSVNNWGIYDDDLLAMAKKKIDLLESQKQPYNLTLLTLDTHTPAGHISSTCRTRGTVKFKGIVKCSAQMVSELTQYIKEKDYLKNTTIVIMGDHLAMVNPEFNKLNSVPDRFVFNHYITSDSTLQKTREEFVHFDHFPTIIDSIGLHVVGGKLGLGISGFGQYQLSDPKAKARFIDLEENIMRYSSTYQKFWLTRN